MPRNDGYKKSRDTRGKQDFKPRAYPADSMKKWIERLVEEAESLAHLRREFSMWAPPPKWAIKYSRQTVEHIEYLEGRGIIVRKETGSARGNHRVGRGYDR